MKQYFLTLLLLLLLVSCGGSDACHIRCDIKGLGNKGIEVIYADRGVKRLSVHPVDDKAEIRLDVPRQSLIEVFTIDNEPLFTIVGQNGDDIEVSLTLGSPSTFAVKGNSTSEAYARVLAASDSIFTHGSDGEVNALISREIHAAPTSMASTLLLINHFRTPGFELQADSLLNLISPDARPGWLAGSYASQLAVQIAALMKNELPSLTIHSGSDTMVRLHPTAQSYSLLVFNDSRKPDSITARLRDLRRDNPRRRLGLLEISLATDSARWQQYLGADTGLWQQAWLPGGASAYQIRTLAVPRLPYYIVIDSLGHHVYRGSSLYSADTLLRSRLHIPTKSDVAPDSTVRDDTADKPVRPEASKTPVALQPTAASVRKK